VTIADFVADLRAPTPSAAAELAVFDYPSWVWQMEDYRRKLQREVGRQLERVRNKAETYRLRIAAQSPQNRILQKRQMLLDLEGHLSAALRDRLAKDKHRLALYAERLNGLSPLQKLQSGYAYVEDGEGKTLLSVRQAEIGQSLGIYTVDGKVTARVESVEERGFEDGTRKDN
jgi:exodeoxyribonuclease VII large subunit